MVKAEIQRQAQIELCRQGEYKAYFKLTQPFALYPHVLFISNLLNRIINGESLKVIFTMPPQNLKSKTITETFPSFFLGMNPDETVIVISYSDGSARRFGIRNRAKFERYANAIWGLEISKDRSQNKYWEIKDHQGKMLSSGITGQITGEGAKLLIIDDPIKNRQEANSAVYRDKVWFEYTNTIETRLHPGASKILITTRWHKDDLVGRILENESGWEVYNLPALARENDPLQRLEGEALCPSWMDEEFFLKKKAVLGDLDFEAIYQGSPTLESGNYFKKEWFRYFKEDADTYLLSDGRAILKQDCWLLQTVDPAGSVNKKSDYFILLTCAVTPDKDILILDVLRSRIDGSLYEKTLMDNYIKWTPRIIGVENKTFGMTILQQMKKHLPLRPCEADTDKVTRSLIAQARYNTGKIFHKSKAPWLFDYEKELLEFDSGEHDDQVDAVSYAAIIVMTRVRVGVS